MTTDLKLEAYDKRMTCLCCNLHADVQGRRKLLAKATSHVMDEHVREVIALQDDDAAVNYTSEMSFRECCSQFAVENMQIRATYGWFYC